MKKKAEKNKKLLWRQITKSKCVELFLFLFEG